MKIVLTGGGTGGHFFPLIAVAEQLRLLHPTKEELELYYFGDEIHDPEAFSKLQIYFNRVYSSKGHLKPSFKTVVNFFKFLFTFPHAFFKLLMIYPDVIFSKGGYVSVPVLLSAQLLRIPVVVHESDSIPGRTNVWSAKFAQRIALSFASSQEEFINKIPKLNDHLDRFQVTGLPMRESLFVTTTNSNFNLNPTIPTILILGGSQGAQLINNTILASLSELLLSYNIIHQTGKRNYTSVTEASLALIDPLRDSTRYIPIAFLDPSQLSESLQRADIVITRAGSGIFEIARAGKPSIIIPITISHGDHQRKNAYNFERLGASKVIEESNLTPSILISTVSSIIEDRATYTSMKESAIQASPQNAALLIAKEIVRISKSH